MKKTVAVVVAFVFVLALAAPVFALSFDTTKEGSMDYNFDVKFDGTVDWERQIGHLCNTGAEWKMSAYGEGEMEATGSTKMVPWKLTADTEMDWVTAPDAVENLIVTSAIELCAPPKQTFSSTDYVYDGVTGLWVEHPGASGLWGPWDRYVNPYNQLNYDESTPPYFFSGVQELWIQEADELDAAWSGTPVGDDPNNPDEAPMSGAGLLEYTTEDDQGWTSQFDPWRADMQAAFPDRIIELADGYWTGGWNPRGANPVGRIWNRGTDNVMNADQRLYRYGHLGATTHLGEPGTSYSDYAVADLTDQIWAVQVEANPGMSGNLHQDFEAAYGPYEGWLDDGIGEDEVIHKDAWGFRTDSDGYVFAERGVDYVGNYFNIDQMARTSDGVVKRYIDISSPWSGALHSEEFEVIGMVEVEEDFEMMNIAEGEESTPDWWDLFN